MFYSILLCGVVSSIAWNVIHHYLISHYKLMRIMIKIFNNWQVVVISMLISIFAYLHWHWYWCLNWHWHWYWHSNWHWVLVCWRCWCKWWSLQNSTFMFPCNFSSLLPNLHISILILFLIWVSYLKFSSLLLLLFSLFCRIFIISYF